MPMMANNPVDAPAAARPIRVAIVDDNAEVSVSVVELLDGAPDVEVVAVYPTGEEAVAGFGQHGADVVLMDLRLPGMSGVQCAGELKRLFPSVSIMMFTAFGEDDEALFQSLRQGANGYVLKRSSGPVLLDAIRELYAGGAPMSPSIARKVVRHFQQAGTVASAPATAESTAARADWESLTGREREVLHMLSQGLRYKEIADQLDLSITTVRTHLGRVYDKLHVTSRTEAVVKYLKAKP